MKTSQNIGSMIYFLRSIRGITQTELSQYARVTQPALANIEKNNPNGYSRNQLQKISNSLGINQMAYNDADLYCFVPEDSKSMEVFAICSVLDAYFSCIPKKDNAIILRSLSEFFLEVGDEKESWINYIPSKIVYKAIEAACKDEVKDFFSISNLLEHDQRLRREDNYWEYSSRIHLLPYMDYNPEELRNNTTVKDYIDDIINLGFLNNPYVKLMYKLHIKVNYYFDYIEFLETALNRIKYAPLDKIENNIKTINKILNESFKDRED